MKDSVPCGDCVLCCKGEFVELKKPHDKVSQYQREFREGKWILAHKPNGDCVYLGDCGCTIYQRRPTVCRSFDCRRFAEQVLLEPALRKAASHKILAHGQKLLELK